MQLFIYYEIREVYVNDSGSIATKHVSSFDTRKDAEEFKRLCTELKPESKFTIVEDYDYA